MIRRNTWITLAVFAVLLAGAIGYSRTHTGSPQPADATPTAAPLWNLQSQDILAMKIEDLEAGAVVEAHRDSSSGWTLDTPKAMADIGRLEIAADTLASLVPTDSVEGADLPSFGLDNPSSRITITRSDGSQEQLLVGQTSPIGDVVYVQLPEKDTVYFVSSYTLANVTGLPGDPPIATPMPEATVSLPTLPPATPTP